MRNKQLIMHVIFIFGISSLIRAQQFTDLYGDYFGQTPPGDSAVIFAPGIVSLPERTEQIITFSPNGKECYVSVWVNNANKIYYFKYNNKTWSAQLEANHIPGFPFFSKDGTRLYFSKDDDIWMVGLTSGEYGIPKILPSPINTSSHEGECTVTVDGTVYLRSKRPGGFVTRGDIWRILPSSKEAENLGPDINTGSYICCPYISGDGSFLIFSSIRPGCIGAQDLYICFHKGNNEWTKPLNLEEGGRGINIENHSQNCPSISPDGKYLFFRRHDSQGKNHDIYWVSTKIIDNIKNEVLGSSVTDIDGNVYQTVTIGSQVWMAENLKTTRYRNGDTIGTTIPATLDISSEDMPRYQWAYNGDESNVNVYGRLYTWYAATDNRKIAPEGWHVPTNAEWTTLIDFLGGEEVAAGKLKESGLSHWKSPNANSTNESGFTALPAGSRWHTGEFVQLGEYVHFWAADQQYPDWAWRVLLRYDESLQNQRGSASPKIGWPVRCIKDTPTEINNSEIENQIPIEIQLNQNYPNPFNSSTTIQYVLSEPSHAKLVIYDLLGQEIQMLQNGDQNTGDYSLTWNATDQKNTLVSSGIYFYSLQTNNRTLKKKMILIQ